MNAKKTQNLFNALVVLVGVIITLTALLGFKSASAKSAQSLTNKTLDTLARQCQSFENIQLTNKVRNLFSINENLTSLNETFKRDSSLVNDDFLEDYIDGMQLSGIAVLDGNLHLVASGYTRDKYTPNWKDDFYPNLFENMLTSKTQVYAERKIIDGQYYNVCATARQDADGIIIAYYKYPMSLIYDTENDLKQLLKSVRMEMDGEYIIKSGELIITEESSKMDGANFISQAEGVYVANEFNDVLFNGERYYGSRTIYNDYSIYVYFPKYAVFKDAYVWTLVVALVYLGFCLMAVLFKSRGDIIKAKIFEESNKKIIESASIMQSLESIFYTIFFVDLKTDTYRGIVTAPWVLDVVDEKGNFTAAADKLISARVAQEYRETVRDRLSFEKIRANLPKKGGDDLPVSYYTDCEILRDDKKFWCRITLTAVDYDEEQNPSRALVMLQDVDAEKSKEVEFQNRIIKEADLAQAANRAKSSFLFNVSHDIRTPMNAIIGYSALAKQSLDDVEKIDGYLDNIKVSGERMLSLINEVLEFARIENGRTVIDAKATKVGLGIQSCVVIVKPIAEAKNINLTLTYENIKYPYVYVDHPHMSRIVINILNNAIKFTPEGGNVRCVVRQSDCDDKNYCLTEVIIEDDGIGMSKDFLPHMFEMFEREKTSTASGVGGMGLGLGIAKNLAKLMNGDIEVESELGKGSKFTVKIPHKIATEEEAKAVSIEYSIDKDSVKGKRVLIAEDGDMNAEIIMEIISDYGIKADRAKDGLECVKMIETAPIGYYSLVLMDIQMPKADGLTAAKLIRSNKNSGISKVPIIAMTANAFPKDKKRSIDAGMDDHLSKPIDFNELALAFEKYLGAKLFCVENVKMRGGGKPI